MELRKLLHDDDAVSPVIGVILMVAITVILAAVIASFVLGLGGEPTVAPQVSFSFDYESAEGPGIDSSYDVGNLTITHESGETIIAPDFVVRGDGILDVSATDYSSSGNTPSEVSGGVRFDASTGEWSSTSSNNPLLSNQESEMSSSQTVELAARPTYDIDLIWEPEDADESSVITSEEGPDA